MAMVTLSSSVALADQLAWSDSTMCCSSRVCLQHEATIRLHRHATAQGPVVLGVAQATTHHQQAAVEDAQWEGQELSALLRDLGSLRPARHLGRSGGPVGCCLPQDLLFGNLPHGDFLRTLYWVAERHAISS